MKADKIKKIETVADVLERKSKKKAEKKRKAKLEAEKKIRQEKKEAKKLGLIEERIKAQKERILEEISVSYIVSIACQKIGISRATLYRWMIDDREFKREFTKRQLDGRGMINDLAESRLIGKIKNDEIKAITYWLSHMHSNFINPLFAMDGENKNTGLTLEQKIGIADRLERWKAENLRTDKDYTTGATK